MQRRQVEAAAAARNAQTLAHQANQAVFTQKLPDARRGHQDAAAASTAGEANRYGSDQRPDFCPCLQFTLLALQLFKQFCADIAAFNHIQQIAYVAEEMQRSGMIVNRQML
jgi:hypothetical protein